MAIRMPQVLIAWALSAQANETVLPGVSSRDLAEAEAILGRALPQDVRVFYSVLNGGWFLGNNLSVYPLLSATDEELALTTASDLMRSWGWLIPKQVVLFGGDGSDGNFGFWLPRDETARPLMLEFAEAFDAPDCMAVVGNDLASFLAARTACILLSYATEFGTEVDPAMDALGVPEELRALSLDELDSAEGMARFYRWASPDLPDPQPDPYSRGLTAEQIAEIARAAL